MEIVNNKLYAIGGKEDGDKTGFGSRIFTSEIINDKFNNITFSKSKSDPNIYESSRMFKWKDRI